MADKKACPRMFHPDGHGDCMKSGCAWWVDKPAWGTSLCALTLIAVQLDNIAVYKKLEFERQ